ncbi:hypothetical protein ACF0H5_000075 [Mactra antiquata]
MSVRELIVMSKDKYNSLIDKDRKDTKASSIETMNAKTSNVSESTLDNTYNDTKESLDNSFNKLDSYSNINTDNVLQVVRTKPGSISGDKKQRNKKKVTQLNGFHTNLFIIYIYMYFQLIFSYI